MIPLHDNVIVRPIEEKKSGILTPDALKEKPRIGIVEVVSDSNYTDEGVLIKPKVNVGEKILYGKFSGTEYNGVKIMREKDIIAIIE